MKKIVIIIILFFVVGLFGTSNAQWFWQNPLPQGNSLRDVHVFDENNAIAIGGAGTIIRTTDGGLSWTINHSEINLITFHFVNNNIGWAIGYDDINHYHAILRTDDGGQKWVSQYGTSDKYFSDIFFVNADVGWVTLTDLGGTGGILKTTDGGQNWEALPYNSLSYPGSIYFINSNTGWLLGGFGGFQGGGEILKTTNGGVDWFSQYELENCGMASIYFIDDSTGWAAGANKDCWSQTYYNGVVLATTNGGDNWFLQSDSIGSLFSDVYFTDKNNGWAVGLDFESLGGLIIKTTNGGQNWVIQSDSIGGDLLSVCFSESGTGWIVGDAGLILKTSGDNWILQSRASFNDYIHSTQFLDKSTGWTLNTMSINSNRLCKSTDGGENWITLIEVASGQLNSFYFTDENFGWIVGINYTPTQSIILKTTDGGQSWIDKSFGLDLYLNYVYFSDENTGWVIGGDYNTSGEGRILKTTDGGEDWTNQFTIPNFPDFKSAFFIDSMTGWVLFRNSWGAPFFRTTDGGLNWISQPVPLEYPSSVYFINDTTGWMSGTSNLFKTTDGGTSWFPQMTYSDQIISSTYFTNQNSGWLAGYNRYSWESIVLATTDGGSTWIEQPTGSSSRLYDIFFVNNTGWAVGDNGTIFKTTNGGISFAEEEQIDEMPSTILLSQNYPNPFNPSTKIKYLVVQTSQVLIKVYDVLGNEIETLVDENKPAGEYEITWNAVNLPSGVYFYQIKAGDFIQTKKMILLK